MPNNIQLAKNYINNLDEVYRLASVTSNRLLMRLCVKRVQMQMRSFIRRLP